MKEILLTQGKIATVDDEDFERVNQFSWGTFGSCRYKYAKRSTGSRRNRKTEFMHRLILNAPKGMQVDHINGNGLDNRRENIRLCTVSQNQQNRKSGRGSASIYKGVYWHKWNKKWEARIRALGKLLWLGSYDTEVMAATAYNQAARKYFKEFARLNAIPQ